MSSFASSSATATTTTTTKNDEYSSGVGKTVLPRKIIYVSDVHTPIEPIDLDECYRHVATQLKEIARKVATRTLKQQYCISIEGIPGAGKTTALKRLQNHFPDQVALEPVDAWLHVNGVSLLKDLSEGKGTAMHQWYIIDSLRRIRDEKLRHFGVVIQERSIESAYYIFAQHLNVPCNEMRIMDALVDAVLEPPPPTPTTAAVGKTKRFIIYLEVANIVDAQNRSNFITYPLEALEQMHLDHFEWLNQPTSHYAFACNNRCSERDDDEDDNGDQSSSSSTSPTLPAPPLRPCGRRAIAVNDSPTSYLYGCPADAVTAKNVSAVRLNRPTIYNICENTKEGVFEKLLYILRQILLSTD